MSPKKRKINKKNKEEEEICQQFIELIEKKLCDYNDGEFMSISHYTSIIIDGINLNVYIGKENDRYAYFMECFYIIDSDEELLKLLEKDNFETLSDLLKDIKIVINTYHFLDHKLLSPEIFDFAKMQRSFFPLSKDKACSVCYESTNEYTICKHPICFQCRDKCVMSNNLRCPICREENLIEFPEELTFTEACN